MYRSASFHATALGHGEPIRVRAGQRVIFRILNASATDDVSFALPGHQSQVVALDGNPVPSAKAVPILSLAPAERVDAIVEMNRPGAWVFGSTDDDERAKGMGVVVEYAGAEANRSGPSPSTQRGIIPALPGRLRSKGPTTRSIPSSKRFPGAGEASIGAINGKSFPDAEPLPVEAGKRYRLILDNQSGDAHPIHWHRHTFELTKVAGQSTAGVLKDVINVPRDQSAEVDFVADDPGLTLFHCHVQLRQDFGFMTLLKYLR